MPQVPISRADIDGLARKLRAFEPELTEHERTLLSFLVSLAADVIDRSATGVPASPLVSAHRDQEAPVVVTVDEPLPPISEQFESAFTPGAAIPTPRPPGSIGPMVM